MPWRFLLIFVHFKQLLHRVKLYLDVSRVRTQIVGVEGEFADHLTTTTKTILEFFYLI